MRISAIYKEQMVPLETRSTPQALKLFKQLATQIATQIHNKPKAKRKSDLRFIFKKMITVPETHSRILFDVIQKHQLKYELIAVQNAFERKTKGKNYVPRLRSGDPRLRLSPARKANRRGKPKKERLIIRTKHKPKRKITSAKTQIGPNGGKFILKVSKATGKTYKKYL